MVSATPSPFNESVGQPIEKTKDNSKTNSRQSTLNSIAPPSPLHSGVSPRYLRTKYCFRNTATPVQGKLVSKWGHLRSKTAPQSSEQIDPPVADCKRAKRAASSLDAGSRQRVRPAALLKSSVLTEGLAQQKSSVSGHKIFRHQNDEPEAVLTHPTRTSTQWKSVAPWRRLIVFLDLDDTLIPTVWIRNRFSEKRTTAVELSSLSLEEISAARSLVQEFRTELKLQISAIEETHLIRDLWTYKQIRREVDDLTNGSFVSSVIELLSVINSVSICSIIVTNARSSGWLKIFKWMFPEINNALISMNIAVVRTKPEEASGRTEPDIQRDPVNYFQFWMVAKEVEFRKVLLKWLKTDEVLFNKKKISNEGDVSPPSASTMASDVASDILHSNLVIKQTTNGNGSVQEYVPDRMEATCIGDNDFEDTAFRYAVSEPQFKIRFATMIRCAQGLNPKLFHGQVKDITKAMIGSYMAWRYEPDPRSLNSDQNSFVNHLCNACAQEQFSALELKDKVADSQSNLMDLAHKNSSRLFSSDSYPSSCSQCNTRLHQSTPFGSWGASPMSLSLCSRTPRGQSSGSHLSRMYGHHVKVTAWSPYQPSPDPAEEQDTPATVTSSLDRIAEETSQETGSDLPTRSVVAAFFFRTRNPGLTDNRIAAFNETPQLQRSGNTPQTLDPSAGKGTVEPSVPPFSRTSRFASIISDFFGPRRTTE